MSKLPRPYKIADFRHRVAICTMQDVVESNGMMALSRKDVYHCWAYIDHVRLSAFAKGGFSVKDLIDERTHSIVIRYNRTIDYTTSAWIYEERLQSGPRWFKLLRHVVSNEDGEYLICDAKLVERGDEVRKPVDTDKFATVGGAIPLPAGVSL